MSENMPQREEYLTIIAPTVREVMAQFKARGLDAEGYSITTGIGRHQFALVTGGKAAELFPGTDFFAATFRRIVAD